MSLLNDFKADLPITSTRLIEWIKTILGKIDILQIDSSMIDSLYNVNRGTDISNKLSSTTFNAIHDAIAAGKRIEISGTNAFRNVLSAKTFDMPGDDFYSFQITYITFNCELVDLSISNMAGVIFLDGKTITSLI